MLRDFFSPFYYVLTQMRRNGLKKNFFFAFCNTDSLFKEVSSCHSKNSYPLVFFFGGVGAVPHGMWDLSSQTPCHLLWKCDVLTIGPPEKSWLLLVLMIKI